MISDDILAKAHGLCKSRGLDPNVFVALIKKDQFGQLVRRSHSTWLSLAIQQVSGGCCIDDQPLMLEADV